MELEAKLILPRDYFQTPMTTQDVLMLRSNGYTSVCASLITGRCGSTLFSKMCQGVGFGYGEEPFNELSAQSFSDYSPFGFAKFVDTVMQMTSMNGRYYFQITPERCDALAPLFSDSAFAEYVDKFTIILRRNIVAQALSYIEATSSGLWHSFSDDQCVTRVSDEDVSVEELRRWIWEIHLMEMRAFEICSHQESTLVMFYEDIVASPVETLDLFLREHSVQLSWELFLENLRVDTPLKLRSGSNRQRYLKIMNDHSDLRSILKDRLRGIIPTPSIAEFVMKTGAVLGR